MYFHLLVKIGLFDICIICVYSLLMHPQLLAGLKCESQTENNIKTRNWSTFPGSQHYRGVKGHAGAPGGD
jgi:hypothetical protein